MRDTFGPAPAEGILVSSFAPYRPAVFILALVATACATLALAPPPVPGPLRVPAELADSPRWSTLHTNSSDFGDRRIEAQDTQLEFGPFEAVVASHHFTGIGNWAASALRGRWGRKHAYTFVLKEEGEPLWDVRCESRYQEQGGLAVGGSAQLQLGGYERTTLRCGIAAPGDTVPVWTLSTDTESPFWLRTGTLSQATDDDSGCCLIDGYEIRQQGRAIAAASRAWPAVGHVVIAHDLDRSKRSPVAAAVAALLFQRPLQIREELP